MLSEVILFHIIKRYKIVYLISMGMTVSLPQNYLKYLPVPIYFRANINFRSAFEFMMLTSPFQKPP